MASRIYPLAYHSSRPHEGDGYYCTRCKTFTAVGNGLGPCEKHFKDTWFRNFDIDRAKNVSPHVNEMPNEYLDEYNALVALKEMGVE